MYFWRRVFFFCRRPKCYDCPMSKTGKEIMRRWLPLAFIATIMAGLVYGAVQQSYRQSANDPQIQMAEDAAAAIASGAPAQSVVASTSINIADDLAPYVVVYNSSGAPIAGNGMLNGALPALPQGVFTYVAQEGADRFTWQPEAGVRSAVVVIPVNGGSGFVMAGRSLREVEIRESMLEATVGAAWIVAVIGSLLLEMIFAFWFRW